MSASAAGQRRRAMVMGLSEVTNGWIILGIGGRYVLP
jgi:hypothetical protein